MIENGFTLTNVSQILLGILLFGYLSLKFDYNALTFRYGVFIVDESIILREYMFWRTTIITDDIKGYSLSYGNYSIPCIIIYLGNGKHINLPRYLYLNYNDITDALDNNKIPFLGNEPLLRKYVVARYYKYDQ